MAYSRDYPNSIVPKGSKVVECLQNDDKELKRILSLLSDAGGSISLFGSKRQCILHAAAGKDGKPSYLTATGLTITLDGSTTPVIVTFAGGYDNNGTVDKIDTISDKIEACKVPANGTYYLFIDKDSNTGILSYGYTSIPDTYSAAAPASPVLDQCYFNTVDMKMYHYNGASWEQKFRVFVAKAVTTDSAATLSIYPFMSRAAYNFLQYDSDGNLQIVDNLGALTQVMASTFVGALKGNADTATKATTADTATTANKATTADTATSATTADKANSATKAAQDSNGNVISTSYIAMPNTVHNSGAHNALYRGCNITDYFASGEMSKAIASGTFENIYPGDYILKDVTVDGGTISKWTVGDLNYYLNAGDVATTTNHVVLFAEDSNIKSVMNTTDTITDGYEGSYMYNTFMVELSTAVQSEFGVTHVLPYRDTIICNNQSDKYVDIICNNFNDNMLHGSKIETPSVEWPGSSFTSLAAFRHNKPLVSLPGKRYWIRSVNYSYNNNNFFCISSIYSDSAAPSTKLYVRPYFLLY